MKKILSYKIVQFLIIVAIASVLSAVLNNVKTNEYKDWVSTDAVITNWKTANRKRAKHILYFKYDVDGNEYHGQEVFSGNFPENDIGDTVTVWYDPDAVSRAMISDIKPDAGLWPYVPFIFAIPISLFVLSGGYKPRTRSLRS